VRAPWRVPALRRAGWTVSDQALTSIGNLLLAVLVARAVPIGEFGSFAIAFTGYLLALGVSRAVATDPLVVRHSTGPLADRRGAAASAVGAAAGTGALIGAVAALVGLALPGPLASAMLALAVAMPALLVQDAWRYAFFAAGAPRRAAVNDGVRVVVMLLLLGGLAAAGADAAWQFILAWGASAACAGLLGCVQARTWLRLRALPAWWRRHSDLSRDFIGEHLALSGVGILSPVIVAVVAGVGEAAALRGAHVVFGVVNVFLQGSVALVVPEGRRIRDHSLDRLVRFLRYGSALLVALPLVWLLGLLLVPASAGAAVLGETWGPASAVFPAYALVIAATAATMGASLGLRVLEQSRAALVVRLKVLPLSVVGAVVGAGLAGAVGVALAMALATAVGAVMWWRAFGRAVQQAGDASGQPGAAVQGP
jgi:O-antigen/teichoic acid export membrane protein